MTRAQLREEILDKSSFLCVGLDTDIKKIPSHLLKKEDPVFEFNKQIIDKCSDLCVAYKLNIAFYESMGSAGWRSLERTLEIIPDRIFTIADAKRGDIGNTSSMYARTFFETYDFDSITIAPYMGKDSVAPFLGYDDKWVILLALTSNSGSADFQKLKLESGQTVYQSVLSTSSRWSTPEELMYVVGATHPDELAAIRKQYPDHFFLIPGVGAQGGDLQAISSAAFNDHVGMLVNSSRGIIYAGKDEDFADHARFAAIKLQVQMSEIISTKMASVS